MITLKNKKVSLRACLLMCLICIVLTGVVSATPTMKQIVAYLNYGLNIVIDGETKELYNSNGDKIYPITFDGATYVPVRSISELLGVSVDWDGNTNSVLLNTKVEKVNIIQGIEKATDYSYVLGDGQKVGNVSETEVYNFNSGIYCKSLLNEDIKYSEYIVSIPTRPLLFAELRNASTSSASIPRNGCAHTGTAPIELRYCIISSALNLLEGT